TDKGLVRPDDTDRTHIYHPRLTQEQTQRQLIRDLVDRAFGGSASKLVMQALATKRASDEELGEIRRLLDSRASQETDRGPGGHDERSLGLTPERDGAGHRMGLTP